MKYLMSTVFVFMLYGCASTSVSTSSTVISYSPYFKISIPLEELGGAIFFQSDSISVRFSDGSVLSGLIIDKGVESLPSDFDLSEYPEYSLGLKSTSNLSQPYADLFRNSWEETKRIYNNPEVTKTESNGKLIYTACGVDSCLSFLVDVNMSEHILMLSGMNVDQVEYNKLLKGI
ncbi:hypothetical protein [Marinobacter sp. ANT_B65]|uniref:hypothetical protein n=1 Tax=Marinobacter sp. ANT_B65 TaxID=2039467 RepID=UPI000BBECB4A|nr:hypothetical protein [Marinobacter sp. ANT_B65]PCM45859.1 hypothetical protein CPA50_07820 [Marinobacter sp. ANT_B65]